MTRLLPATGTRIDIVVGTSSWQHTFLARAPRVSLMGGQIPVALPFDLVLLKLYAGGPQDAWDIHQLLDAVPNLAADVEAAVASLRTECATLWRHIVGARPLS